MEVISLPVTATAMLLQIQTKGYPSGGGTLLCLRNKEETPTRVDNRLVGDGPWYFFGTRNLTSLSLVTFHPKQGWHVLDSIKKILIYDN